MWTDAKEIDQPAAPLSRQPSIYSLTFDEFQSTMGGIGSDGKEFGSMNMEEFLKNLWTAEEGQAMGDALGGSDCGGPGALQRQGSLTLPRTLSQKTVDDVWRDLICDNTESAGGSESRPQQRQSTLGEMTLEEFLVRAGVVREEIKPTVVNTNSNTNSTVYFGDMPASGNINPGFTFSFPQADQSNGSVMPKSLPVNSGSNMTIFPSGVISPFTAQLPLGSNVDIVTPQGMGGGVIGIVDPVSNSGPIPGMVGLGVGAVGVTAVGSPPVNQISYEVISKVNGDLSSLSPVNYVFNRGLKGRKGNGAVEKVVERRQRRMIKNRESAARSRARKQAYTLELEAEIAKLKEKNQELQDKQMELMELQKIQVLEHLDQQLGPKKLCLRRTQTGRW